MRVYDRSTITIQSIQVLRQRQFITAISTDVVMLGKTITQFIVMNEFFTGNFGNVHASIEGIVAQPRNFGGVFHKTLIVI